MSWSSNMMVPLRVLINDMDQQEYKYTDEILKQLLATAAKYVMQEVNLSIDYSVCFNLVQISPDPSADDVFVNLVVMKAACLTNQWKFNEQAIKRGVRAKCGPVNMQTDSPSSSILLALINGGFCDAYSEMKKQHNFGNSDAVRAVLSPFSHCDSNISGYGSDVRNV